MILSRNGKSATRRLSSALLACSLMFAPALVLAEMQLKMENFQEVEVVKDGKKVKQRQTLSKALPGQEVIYQITYLNTGAKPVDNVVINNPVPSNLSYQGGTAQGEGTRIEYSVDGGKTFGAMETLSVKGADGSSRAAKSQDVTHLRWTVITPVKPGAKGTVGYRALVK